MTEPIKLGIIICDRYRRCAGGKCFRAVRNREGAFSRYKNIDIDVVGYTSCDGCPGGNIEYAVDEMKGNGATVIHLATGLVVGYPPCPHLTYFHDFITTRYGIEVVYGTHPIPQKYLTMHDRLGTWQAPEWEPIIQPTLADEEIRIAYSCCSITWGSDLTAHAQHTRCLADSTTGVSAARTPRLSSLRDTGCVLMEPVARS